LNRMAGVADLEPLGSGDESAKENNAMANTTIATCLPLCPSLEMAWRDVDSSFERFCLTAWIGAVEQMLPEDAQQLTGAPHRRGGGRVGHRSNPTCHFRVSLIPGVGSSSP
jgi:hypothetical protein